VIGSTIPVLTEVDADVATRAPAGCAAAGFAAT
jgi:hypothetical protein